MGISYPSIFFDFRQRHLSHDRHLSHTQVEFTVLCSGAIPTVSVGGQIGPVFSQVKTRSGMEKAAKLQQVRFISAPTDDGNSSDHVEDATLSDGGGDYEMVSVGERLGKEESVGGRISEERSIVSMI